MREYVVDGQHETFVKHDVELLNQHLHEPEKKFQMVHKKSNTKHPNCHVTTTNELPVTQKLRSSKENFNRLSRLT